MDTSALRLFVLAADMLNISAAGRKLGLTPSMASARLSKLEILMGADLFHRTTRKVALSIEGTEFLPYAREILAQEDAAFAALGQRETKVSGTLRFAASSTFAQRFISPILPEFLARYPGITIELRLSDTQVGLIEGGFDLALRNYAIEDCSLIGRRIAKDKRVLCASPDYLKKHGTPDSPDALQFHQLIGYLHAKPRKLRKANQDEVFWFPPHNTKPRIIVDDGASMRIAARSGAGICMSSIWSIHTELKEGSLVRVLPDYTVEDNAEIWLVYPKSNVLTSKVRVFIDYLIEKIGEPPIWEV